MTVEADEDDSTTAADRLSDAVLDAYTARMRRRRGWYYGGIAVLVLAIVATVAVAWSHGEVAHTTLKTAPSAAPSVAVQTPAATVTQAWTSSDHTAIGTPYWGGTAITYDTHTVRGRNASTGAVTWSYSRSDRTVCTAMQSQGVTIAVYKLGGNCDELTALDSQTGARRWTRTLDENGQPIIGEPTYQVTPYTFMVITPTVIYAIDPSSGIDRWLFGQRPGDTSGAEANENHCRINSAVLGTAGALISQTCTDPVCSTSSYQLTYCHNGTQLLLRNGSNSQSDDDSQKNNPDQIIWDRANTSWRPASADQLISAIDPATGLLYELDSTKGTTLDTHPLGVPIPPGSAITAVGALNTELLWAGGHTFALTAPGATVLWSTPSTGAPAVVSTVKQFDPTRPDLTSSVLTIATSTGVSVLDPTTGKPSRRYSISPPAPGDQAYALGAGFIVAGATTTVYQ